MKKFIQVLVLIGGLSSISGAVIHQVNIFDFGFNPPNLTVTQGDTVRWTNTGASLHTSTSDAGSADPWNSGLLGTGQSYQRQFNILGSFGYHCTPHPFMTGTVTVEQITDVEGEEDRNLPREFTLLQNYPNPFNASTTISYLLPSSGEVSLTIHNLLGQTVNTLVRGRQSAGSYSIVWEGRNQEGNLVSSGIYFYQLETASLNQVRKMVFLK